MQESSPKIANEAWRQCSGDHGGDSKENSEINDGGSPDYYQDFEGFAPVPYDLESPIYTFPNGLVISNNQAIARVEDITSFGSAVSGTQGIRAEENAA